MLVVDSEWSEKVEGCRDSPVVHQFLQLWLERMSACSKCDEIIGEAVLQEEKFCTDVETKRYFYVGANINRGYDAAAILERIGCVRFWKCGNLLCGTWLALHLRHLLKRDL